MAIVVHFIVALFTLHPLRPAAGARRVNDRRKWTVTPHAAHLRSPWVNERSERRVIHSIPFTPGPLTSFGPVVRSEWSESHGKRRVRDDRALPPHGPLATIDRRERSHLTHVPRAPPKKGPRGVSGEGTGSLHSARYAPSSFREP